MGTSTNGKVGDIGQAIREALISPNVPDSNLESANLVDTTQRIGTAIFELAGAVSELAEAQRETDRTLDHLLQTYRRYAGGGR